MERWASVNEENKHLATLRVYNNAKPNGQARIFMFLPPNIDPSSSSLPPSGAPPHNPTRPYFAEFTKFQTIGPEPDVYELDMVNDHVENQIVVAERPKDNSFNISDDPQPKNQPVNSRARTTILTGRILHECSMRPGFSANYRKQMRKRHELYNTKTRTVKRIEQAGISGGRGGINMLTSGVGVHSGGTFGDLVVRSPAIPLSYYVTKPYFSQKTRQKPQKGQFERMARMPRNQLLDLLFQLFRDMPMWTLRNLREKTQQPEAYLKEVLSEVAMLHRSGEHNGHWELKENFKEEGVSYYYAHLVHTSH